MLLLALSGACSFGQEQVMLEGTVLNDTIEKAALNVVNISLRKGAITNSLGEFVLPVRVNDTINISAVQYESRQFVVTKIIFNRKRISLYLIPKINELEEVQLSNVELTGDITQDVQSTVLKTRINAATLGLPQNAHPTFTPEERRFYAATGGAGAIGALLNAISGRTKMLKKHLEVSQLQAKVYGARDKFSDSLYMRELKISEDLIEDFVYFVFEDDKAISQANLLELLDYMMIKSKQYLALREREN